MAKRVSMKGRGLEAVYGDYKTTPVRRTTGVDVYRQGGAQANEPDHSLLKATFYLDRETIELLERLWLDQRKSGRRGSSKSALVRMAIRLLAERN
jgi:hypothetical protein